MSETTTTKHIRSMMALRWRERDPHGVWFWGTWWLMRIHVLPIFTGVAGVVVAFLVTDVALRG